LVGSTNVGFIFRRKTSTMIIKDALHALFLRSSTSRGGTRAVGIIQTVNTDIFAEHTGRSSRRTVSIGAAINRDGAPRVVAGGLIGLIAGPVRERTV